MKSLRCRVEVACQSEGDRVSDFIAIRRTGMARVSGRSARVSRGEPYVFQRGSTGSFGAPEQGHIHKGRVHPRTSRAGRCWLETIGSCEKERLARLRYSWTRECRRRRWARDSETVKSSAIISNARRRFAVRESESCSHVLMAQTTCRYGRQVCAFSRTSCCDGVRQLPIKRIPFVSMTRHVRRPVA